MKKYLFGLLAVVLAVGFSAFTTPKKAKTASTHVFVFDGSGSYANDAAMQNKANWDYEGLIDDVDLCDGYSLARGCKIVIDEAQLTSVPNATNIGQPLSSFSTSGLPIDARNDINSSYFRVFQVTGTSGYTALVSNQVAP